MIFICLILTLFLISSQPALAIDPNATESATVTATVPEFIKIAPDTPVLISPKNSAIINTRSPNFIFNPSDGITLVSHYQLWLDGVKNTDHIPQSTITIAANALIALNEGQHTWMIKAIGVNGATRDSATWSFTIDTTAPLILINQVAQQETSLSSLDLTTIPPGLTFSTANRLPNFIGQSEANATLTITLSSNVTPPTILTVLLDANGTFNLKPNSNLPYAAYTVSITSTDLGGNSTTLPVFNLEIKAKPKIIIPFPSPLPTISFPAISLKYPLQIPSLPQSLQLFPLTPGNLTFLSYLPWIIILSLLLHLSLIIYFYLYRHDCCCLTLNIYQKTSLFITILLPGFILIGLTFLTAHWIPLILTIFILILFNLELKIIQSKYIKKDQY